VASPYEHDIGNTFENEIYGGQQHTQAHHTTSSGGEKQVRVIFTVVYSCVSNNIN
jgi:hypothetical protein